MSSLANLRAKITNLRTICLQRSNSQYLMIALVVLLLLFTVGIGFTKLIAKYIDPNLYKADIEKFILEEIGQTVTFEGPIHVGYKPFPVFEVENVAIKDKSITAKNLKIYPNVRSLFSDTKQFELHLTNLQYKTYQIPEFYTNITVGREVVELQDTRFELVRGKVQGSIAIDTFQIDISGEKLIYRLQHHGENFPLGFFIALNGGDKQMIKGENIRLKLDLIAEGEEFEHIRKSLAGQLEMEITKGRFKGTDLVSALKKAKSFVGTVATKLTEPLVSGLKTLAHREDDGFSSTTPFEMLKIKANLKNGILDNHDLNIDHHHYKVQGKGKVNLTKNTVNYRIEAIYKEKAKAKQNIRQRTMPSAPLVIFISGAIENPNIKTDFDSYLKYIKPKKTKKFKKSAKIAKKIKQEKR
jgi:uncharacterized protein involved in outer membrane biogenesis